jgi:hypothetical protein
MQQSLENSRRPYTTSVLLRHRPVPMSPHPQCVTYPAVGSPQHNTGSCSLVRHSPVAASADPVWLSQQHHEAGPCAMGPELWANATRTAQATLLPRPVYPPG